MPGVRIPLRPPAWPEEREPVVADLDVSGGALGALHGLPSMPGLTTLTAMHGRGDPENGGLLAHCQQLPGGLRVLVAPASPSAIAGALQVVGAELPRLGAAAGVDVLVDAGRLVIGEGPGLALESDLVALHAWAWGLAHQQKRPCIAPISLGRRSATRCSAVVIISRTV